MKNAYLQVFKAHGSKEDGYLSAIEKNTGLPFEIKRVYTVVDTKDGNIRGFHAHKTLQQVFFALTGKIVVKCENIYGEKEEFVLDHPHVGLVCNEYVWHTVEYQNNAILMVLASDGYNEDDYIREYSKFEQLKEGKEYENCKQ